MTTVKLKESTEPNTVVLIVNGGDDSMSYHGDITRYPLMTASIDTFHRTIEYAGVIYSVDDIASLYDLMKLLKPSNDLFYDKNNQIDKSKLQYQYSDLVCMWRYIKQCPIEYVLRFPGQIKIGDIIAFTKENPLQEPLNYKGDDHDDKIVQLPYVLVEEVELIQVEKIGYSGYDLSYMKNEEIKTKRCSNGLHLSVKR